MWAALSTKLAASLSPEQVIARGLNGDFSSIQRKQLAIVKLRARGSLIPAIAALHAGLVTKSKAGGAFSRSFPAAAAPAAAAAAAAAAAVVMAAAAAAADDRSPTRAQLRFKMKPAQSK